MNFLDTIREDLRASGRIGNQSMRMPWLLKHILHTTTFSISFSCVFWFRINHWMYINNIPGAIWLNVRRYYWFGNDISFKTKIGPGLHFAHLSDIVISGNAVIGERAHILNGVTIGSKTVGRADRLSPTIGDNVYIGTGAKVIGDIKIGDNVAIGALAFCDKDVPSDTLFYGIPPHVTVKPKPDDTIRRQTKSVAK